MTTTVSLADLESLVGVDLEPSDWLTIHQDRIDTFADATDDHQWIHCDPERAKDGPFGRPIAHGYLTLALVVPLFAGMLDVSDASTVVNYGLDKVRFPSPVPEGSRIRLVATVVEVSAVAGGKQLTFDAAVEADGAPKPACIARPVFRFYA
ncbi:MAG: MaoC family dehydratase [Propionibacteriaceae bacterium]|nr:MaoC family dehydratase [Propionibacteriaceae bacterium]